MRIPLLLTLLLLGCSGSKEAPPPKGASTTTQAQAQGAEAPAAHPLGRWARDAEPEPTPAARGLYRRAVDMIAEGQEASAAALFEQIPERYPHSRYAKRLSADGPGAVVLASAVALVGAFWIKTTAARRDVEPAPPAGGHPAP